MSKVLKCEHCGEVFATSDVASDWTTPTKLIHGDYGTKRKWLNRADLCPKCSAEFYEWLWEKHKTPEISTSKKYKSDVSAEQTTETIADKS